MPLKSDPSDLEGNGNESIHPSTTRRTIQLAGLSVVLSKPTKHVLYIKCSIDGRDFPKMPYVHDSDVHRTPEGPLRWSLDPFLNLQEGSNLTLQLCKRRRVVKDTVLAQVVIPFGDVRSHLDSVTLDHYIEYQVYADPKIWLDLAAGPYSLQTSLNAAVRKSQELMSVLDHLGKAKMFLMTLLEISTAISELDPIAKAVLGCVNVIFEKLNAQDECEKLVADLAENMARTIRYIQDVEQFARLTQLKQTIEEVFPLLEETQNFILLLASRSGMANFLKTSSIQERADSLSKRYNTFQRQFDRGIAIDAGAKTELLLKIHNIAKDDAVLKQLRPRGIETSPLTTECLEGTRQTILSYVDTWINDFAGPNILWIRGFPGVGKSALASSIVSRLRAQHRLGSYFIFDRAKVVLATPNVLWRCVAYDLARQYPSARKCIVERLEEEEVEVNSSNIKTLFRSLIEEPLSESTDIPLGRLPVIIIDALDECGGLQGRQSEDREDLLDTLRRWPRLSRKFKLIVTSREEDDIADTLSSLSTIIDISSGTSVSSQASDDIRTFLVHRFHKIAQGYQDSLPSDWPGPVVIDKLTTRAAGLFIWAKTVTEVVNSGEPQTQLKEIMVHSSEMGDMALLYSCILQTSFRLPGPEVLDAFNVLVGAMVLAKRPLRRVEYIDLLKIEPSMLDFVRKGLRSVMEPGTTLRFTHQSFVDFLLYSDKCPSEFVVDVEKQQYNLIDACLHTMSAKLCFNICDLETSTLRDADVPDIETKIKSGIPTHLSYSCRYWADHLSNVQFSVNLMVMVKQVVYDLFLYWLEVMSLLNELNLVAPILTTVLDWSEVDNDETFTAFINDALRFVSVFGYAIGQSTPHIYVSALPFAPTNSHLAQRFLPKYTRTIKLTTGKPNNWPSILFVSEEHTQAVNSVAFSPDQENFVSGSSDKTICICDADTGDLVSGPFEGHESSVASVAFSPDGLRVVSGSDDLTARVWDAESGDELMCLRGHENVVTCVIYSHDGRRIASASHDATIRLWDADSGEGIGSLFRGHESGVTSIAFSSDDRLIASGAADRTVRIWDADNGECVRGPFVGHASGVNAVTFSPDGLFVASGSEDETILIWDTETGDLVGDALEGHTDAVTSIAYSADGKLLISGSHDETVRVFDPSTGRVLFGPLFGHTNGITSIGLSRDGKKVVSCSRDETVRMWDLDARLEASPTAHLSARGDIHIDNVTGVAFSPCGTKLVSCSDDDTVRVWDTATGKAILGPIIGHSSWVNTVKYSADGMLIASGSDDQTIRIWDAETGEPVSNPLKGHRSGITSLQILPNNERLVSGSHDGSVRIWNVKTAEDLFGPLIHHSSWVTCVAISPDGDRAISSSHDKTIKMWSTETGELIPIHFQDHVSTITCVAFSPSGKLIASGSIDDNETIQVWDAETGELIAGPFLGHTQLIYCIVFSPNERFIASSSGDRTIRIWDVATRQLVLGPLYGHAGAVVSVAFSGDGKRMVSCSEDETIRVWDTSDLTTSTSSSGEHRLQVPFHVQGGHMDACTIQNGWVAGPGGELIFWIPPWNISGLWWPRNTAVIAATQTRLDFTKFEYGVNWQRCQGFQP
ncbi:WD40 repeat-like protein [Macrolepiota fuliginosa MF-IS2]|uniref:WD40 repeat-like protein n=1 Tax=Macrolepiota fuliginosa MF-IS2 TaxID=1400762 RepID=A0A9P5XDN9_9AGAR|nr:WD40 repeat-like protein [Macrolepiota fuliginosa MF-IS2]